VFAFVHLWGIEGAALAWTFRNILDAALLFTASARLTATGAAAGPATAPRRELRLYANTVPHTTQKASRSCISCHADPFTLGLGTGALDLTGETLRFTPAIPAASAPGLAADAWAGLFPASPAPGTRTGARSLDAEEQRRALRAGACLLCHDARAAIWATFPAALARLARGDAPTCRGRVTPWMVAP